MDDDSEGDCQEIAALWENQRMSQRTSDATQSDKYSNNIDTADDGLYSIVIDDREDSVSYNRIFVNDYRFSDFEYYAYQPYSGGACRQPVYKRRKQSGPRVASESYVSSLII